MAAPESSVNSSPTLATPTSVLSNSYPSTGSSSDTPRPSMSSTRPGDVATLSIPDIWRPEVMQCLNDKYLTDSARNEMVRCLVNLLFSISHKPARSLCEEMARKLILKYPSVKDELGNGYVSLCLSCVYIAHKIYLC